MPIYLLWYVFIVLNCVLPTALGKFEIERTQLQRKHALKLLEGFYLPSCGVCLHDLQGGCICY